ncbi:transcriptional regulatory protein [Leminorella grimontii]|uniref:Transcriptional regulatory protein n=1 Tax=Leminorella grimontii TaxID=82981 RepID=A0AAV5N2X6_9GAMM|nr:two-component response regulator DpiA [Leminorella grimontii]KFC94713.1 two-component response regulator [Leminorella grimontii ATCC 33999 = DSM 5078]GKX56456.1 transcriptional regulatory protein [Leminorella grimontii]GKX59943.1 transcriptional regulatory protein [Leminorella grimontii]VFS61339.1 Destabilizer of plasmid inheritance [Leminorella grimontii]
MKYLNILIIEDETPLAEMHAEFIKRHSACRQVWLAGNLEQGRMMIANFKPDLIVLDNYLPDGKGIELLQELSAAKYQGQIIFITAASDIETVADAIRYGVFDYLIKPVSYDRLEQTLERLSHLHRVQRQAEDVSQWQVDEMFNTFARIQAKPSMPIGIDEITLKVVQDAFIDSGEEIGYTAEDIAKKLGLSRTTARRYLEFCTKESFLKAEIIYGKVGRPQRIYRLSPQRKEN